MAVERQEWFGEPQVVECEFRQLATLSDAAIKSIARQIKSFPKLRRVVMADAPKKQIKAIRAAAPGIEVIGDGQPP